MRGNAALPTFLNVASVISRQADFAPVGKTSPSALVELTGVGRRYRIGGGEVVALGIASR
jgi:hypothetical protein